MDRDILQRRIVFRSQNIFQFAARTKHMAPLLIKMAGGDPLPGIRGYSVFIADAFCMENQVGLAMKIMEANILKLIATIKNRGSFPALSMADGFFGQGAIYTREEKFKGLDSILKVVSRVSDRPFLAFGTLLGYVREKDFMAHDDENYGNWRQPSRYHDAILTSRLTDFSMPIVRYTARRHFFRLCTKGHTSKVAALLSLIMDKYPDDPFWKEVFASFPEQLIQ